MTDELETQESSEELEEAVEASFSLDGWACRATYATDGTTGALRVYLDGAEVAEAGDRWSRSAPVFDAETLEATAREGLARVYAAVGAPMARAEAFTEQLRERFSPSAAPGDPDQETTVLANTSISLDDGRTLELAWAESTDGSVGVATATCNGRQVFDDVWRSGKAGPSWDAESLEEWARERVQAGR